MASNHMLATGARAAGPLDFFLAGFAGGQPDRAIGTVAFLPHSDVDAGIAVDSSAAPIR
jgi:hypothetical protein